MRRYIVNIFFTPLPFSSLTLPKVISKSRSIKPHSRFLCKNNFVTILCVPRATSISLFYEFFLFCVWMCVCVCVTVRVYVCLLMIIPSWVSASQSASLFLAIIWKPNNRVVNLIFVRFSEKESNIYILIWSSNFSLFKFCLYWKEGQNNDYPIFNSINYLFY